jgi:hypothetical protein
MFTYKSLNILLLCFNKTQALLRLLPDINLGSRSKALSQPPIALFCVLTMTQLCGTGHDGGLPARVRATQQQAPDLSHNSRGEYPDTV